MSIEQIKKSKYNTDPKNINIGSVNITEDYSSERIPEEELELLAQDNSVLEKIVNEVRDNPAKGLETRNRKIFGYLNEANKKEFYTLKTQTESLKKDLIENINNSKDAFSLNISQNALLQKYCRDIFGGNKQSISFDDYTVLLELKKVLEIEEQKAISEVELV